MCWLTFIPLPASCPAISAKTADAHTPSLSLTRSPQQKPIDSSKARTTLYPSCCRSNFLLQIHLKPVSVSSNRIPSFCARALVILDDTVLATTASLEPESLFLVKSQCASSIPISLPENIRHVPSPCSSATASLSASGSLASTSVAPFSCAVLKESSSAPLPSSGLGYATVGNSGSGVFCSFTPKKGLCPKDSKARWAKGAPTPCMAV
mmetsp:Transcript_11056/g.27099  ORF Transcript_11056/g.27099 Transcript_11056/m.27099 type:complete len:208 (+) Transcript_11056:488-1111(+)